MHNCILNSIEKRILAVLYSVMFFKVFDEAWHKGLIHKIKSHGVDSNLLNWVSSYLQNRKQRVVINNSSSSLLKKLYSDTKILSKYIPSL